MSKKFMPRAVLLILISLAFLGGVFGKSLVGSENVARAGDVFSNFLPIINTPHLDTLFGAEMNPLSNSQGLQKMVDAKISWTRRNAILWSEVEPVQGGGYDWSVLEGLEADILRAQANHLELIMIVRGVPEWARVAPLYNECGPIDPAALPAFGDFMHAVVTRYSAYPYSVRYWEIWNEPDVAADVIPTGDSPYGCLGDSSDTTYYGGQAYAGILQAVYPRVKQANPDAQVLVGGLLMDCSPLIDAENCYQSRYLEGILEAGGASYFDGVSFHAYDYYSFGQAEYQTGIYGNPGWGSGGWGDTLNGDLKPVLVEKVAYLKSLLDQYGVQGKYLLNTETALLCGGFTEPSGGPGCESDPNSNFEKLKATYVSQVYASALAEGLVSNIWFTPLGWRNSALLNTDFSPRPAYDALVISRQTLQDGTFIREVHEYNDQNVFGYEFNVHGEVIWLLWTLDGKSHTITLGQTPAEIFDEIGTSVTLNAGTLTVAGLKSYYLDWTP
ncbi:MAG TPA: hypothetical protein PK530_10590 [Anaerolineales bacterium]|nr:hypothetical protein [Anaerolineales bacterium]